MEREGAQAAARNTLKRGAIAAAPAPQASLTVSRQPLPRRPFDKLRGSLRSSPNLAAAQLALRAQTVLADCFQVWLRYSAAQKGDLKHACDHAVAVSDENERKLS